MRRILSALVAATLLAGVAAVPGRAADVDVALSNPGGSRTLYVENMLGQPLSDLDFGRMRSQPFRVRVVDQTMDRQGFTVSASMTNLYREGAGGALEWDTTIPSAQVSLGNSLHPLNALNVQAVVQPLVDAVITVTDLVLCADLGLPIVGTACTIAVDNVQALPQTANVTVDLGALNNLPLVPQAAETGAFTNPDFGGVAASDPNKPASPTPTSRRVLGGAATTTAALLSTLTSTLEALVDSSPVTSVVDTNVLSAALNDAVGPLLDTQLTTLLAGPIAFAVEGVLDSQVLSQTGTYMSLPVLSVAVPADAAKGAYRGTLVVTALQP